MACICFNKMADKIEIYGQEGCSLCDKAKALCEKRGLPYTYYEIGTDIDVSEFARLFPSHDLSIIVSTPH